MTGRASLWMCLGLEVAAMFRSLDGSDRYHRALAYWVELGLAANRDAFRDRYASRLYREQHKAQRRARYQNDSSVRERRLSQKRKPQQFGPVQAQHGTLCAYYKRRCLCDACRAAAAEMRRAKKAEKARAA